MRWSTFAVFIVLFALVTGLGSWRRAGAAPT